ncbi:MAG: beta-glucuronidase [Lachnospiraceae bacterium]|nr:beta-glucuronidase [Lachnospiraceae bacterium]
MYPIENKAHSIISLDGMWDFALGQADGQTDINEEWIKEFPKDCESLYVPASYNDQREDEKYRSHRGKAYYHKNVTVPSIYEGQRLFLRFDAVAHDAWVYLNGKLLVTHRGGFLPFEAEITELIKTGDPFSIVVVSDNKIDHSTLPVGNEEGTAFFGSDNAQVPAVREAKRLRGSVNLPNFDFFNYCGINRHVRIISKPREFISELTLSPVVSGDLKSAEIRYKINVDGKHGALDPEEGMPDISGAKTTSVINKKTPVIEVSDRDGKAVSSGEGFEGSLKIEDPRLWEPYPGDPYLYSVTVRYGEDEYTELTGIRSVRTEGTKLLINNKPFYFKGFGKHEDFYIGGRGVNELLNAKDISLLHWINANSFRTSHYPYAEEMYRLCDREGIVVIDETPAVGINAGPNLNPYEEFPLKEYHKQVLKEMIDRDKNHPCIVMWSLGNEPDTENFPESAYDYWRELYDLAHELDPQNRPVTLVCCQNDYTRDLVTRTMDVVCINRYYGWYNLSGDMKAACMAWNIELDFWEKQGKPVMVTEYGCDCIQGLHGTNGEMFTEEFQANYYRLLDAEFDKRDFFIGEHCWAFADFGTLQGVMRPDGNKKGVFTRERRPKLSAHFLKERWEKIPNFNYK